MNVLSKFMNELTDIGTLKFILGISGVLIGFLLTVAGYFIKMKSGYDKKEREQIAEKINDLACQQKEAIDKLSSVVETVSITVNNLRTIVEVIKEQQAEANPRTERRLNNHSKEIQDMKTRVAKIETYCRLDQSPK